MNATNLIAIYDFEFFPYALGDVLTWNIRAAMRCEELGKHAVDIYICVDEKNPASIYQRGLINPDNFDLFFSELYGAFSTNPKLGNIFIFRQREAMIFQLQTVAAKDEGNLEALADYFDIIKSSKVSDTRFSKILDKFKQKLKQRSIVIKNLFNRFVPKTIQETVRKNISTEYVLNHYFIKYIYSHEEINKFFAKKEYIPLLKPSLGCAPDIDEICGRLFKGKKIVPFHLRLRRLDAGYGGDHTYARDSNFLEWYDFLRRAGEKYPEVQFVALGRLQEKPLEILRLPNVTSLRIYGMGLGHELTLMLRSDLFIGTSSGFAALANFSLLPYFITRMNPGSCHAYAIPEGAERLPFAKENQKLIYEPETSELLMTLLERGLELVEHNESKQEILKSGQIDINTWLSKRAQPINSAATTCRFYTDDNYRYEESAYLLLPYLEQARKAYIQNEKEIALTLVKKLKQNFPELCEKMPEYLLLQDLIALEDTVVT